MTKENPHSLYQNSPCKILQLLGLFSVLLLGGCATSSYPESTPTSMVPVILSPELVASSPQPDQGESTLHIIPATAHPGELISIRGSGFQPEETIMVVIQAPAQSYLYGAQALKNGEYVQEIVLLDTLPTGVAITIEALGQDSGRYLNGAIETINAGGSG